MKSTSPPLEEGPTLEKDKYIYIDQSNQSDRGLTELFEQLDTGHCTGHWILYVCSLPQVHTVLDVHLPRWILDINCQGPQIV